LPFLCLKSNGAQGLRIMKFIQLHTNSFICWNYCRVSNSYSGIDFVSFDFTYNFSLWHVFIPPMLFGAPFEVFLNQNYSRAIIILSILALVTPICSIILYYRLMPTFEHNLEKLMEETAKNKKRKWKLGDFMAR